MTHPFDLTLAAMLAASRDAVPITLLMSVVIRRPDEHTRAQRERFASDRQKARRYEARPNGSTLRDIRKVYREEVKRGRQARQ